MHLNHLNVLFLHFCVFWSKIHTWVHSNLLHINKFCQYHLVPLLYSAMCLFFPDPEPPIIKILYGWLYDNFSLCFVLFSFVILSKLSILWCMIMTVKEKLKCHPDVVDYFKKLPFYNKPTEKPNIKCLKNIDLLSELPFYVERNIIKTNHVLEEMQWVTKLK